MVVKKHLVDSICDDYSLRFIGTFWDSFRHPYNVALSPRETVVWGGFDDSDRRFMRMRESTLARKKKRFSAPISF